MTSIPTAIARGSTGRSRHRRSRKKLTHRRAVAENFGALSRATAAVGKGLYLTEFGTQTYDHKADDPAPGSFKASLKDMELLIRALNLGIDGANHWSFTNRGELDGQW